jgi:hypothetical protein
VATFLVSTQALEILPGYETKNIDCAHGMMAILHAHLGARLVFHKVFARSRPKTLN